VSIAQRRIRPSPEDVGCGSISLEGAQKESSLPVRSSINDIVAVSHDHLRHTELVFQAGILDASILKYPITLLTLEDTKGSLESENHA